MKNLLLTLAATSLLAITSCSDAAEEITRDVFDIGLEGTINYDGQSYGIRNGVFSQQNRDGNAEAQFFLADGSIASTTSGVSPGDSQIIISMTAFSKGSQVIDDGDYATSTIDPDKYCFVTVTTIGESRVNKQSFTGGTVSISGSNDTYAVTFDVPFGQGITLTGSVSGTYVDPTSEL
ncbi:MAG: hypothetical protein HRT61_08670 [Ekhidna sp.]|nr:hypothetical protein [Ekhidna sp.]